MSDSLPAPRFYLGIDLGGTNIRSGVVDDQGNPLSAVSVKTFADRGPEFGLDNLVDVGRQAVKQSGVSWDRIAAVGLGSPGTMDLEAGMLVDPPNLPGWNNLPIRKLLADRLMRPTVMQNDANAAAYAEYWVGRGRGTRSLVMFTLGTGIGCGIVIEGQILEGRHSHGAECGHMIVQMEGNARQCTCGAFGHLEAYASATSLIKRACEALEGGGAEEEKSVLGSLSVDKLSGRTISEAAKAGDLLARRLMRETAHYLAVGAVNLMHTIDPDIVLFGGGMIGAGETFLEHIRSDVRSMAFPIPGSRTRIEFAELGGDAGFIGAAGWAKLSVSNQVAGKAGAVLRR
jgi:glucokinase